MAIADLTLFWNDRLHISQTVPVLSASSTAPGYAIDNVREPELYKGWLPNDGTSDEYLQVDGGSTTWVGAAGTKLYVCIAYDGRNRDQQEIRLQYDTADNPAFSSIFSSGIFATLGGLQCDWGSITIPTPAKRYYRLAQPNANRAGGNKCAKILAWAMFSEADIDILSTGFVGNAEAPYRISSVHRLGMIETAGALPLVNRNAATGQRFGVEFNPASESAWSGIRDRLHANFGPARNIFVQKEGLLNSVKQNFFLCMVRDMETSAAAIFGKQYETSLLFETVPWF